MQPGHRPDPRSIVFIDHPPPPTSGEPATVQLDARCETHASGTYDPTEVHVFVSVSATLNGAGHFPGALVGSVGWNIPNIGPCWVSATTPNKIVVTLKYKHAGLDRSHSAPREFFGGGSDCTYYYDSPGVVATSAGGGRGRPIQELLPRYYRLSLHAFSGQPRPALGAFAGGLLQSSPMYLAYDEDASTPEEAVWRAFNLPAMCGRWTLRVRGAVEGLTGDLILHTSAGDQIAPPLRFYSPCWNPQGVNHLGAAGNGRTGGNGALAGASLLVEPA